MTRSPGRGPSVLLAGLCLLAALVATGCARDASDRAAARKALESPVLDDAFFDAFDALLERAADDPDAARDAARVAVEAMGRALVTADPGLDRLLGVQDRDPYAAGRFLDRAAAHLGREGPEAAGVAALAQAWDRRASNLEPAVTLAASHGPLAPGVRLLLASRLLDALRPAAAEVESRRGKVLLDGMPGWPVPYSRNPTDAAFPHALRTLGILLVAGDGGRAVLANAYGRLAMDAQAAFGGRPFAMPVTLGAATPVAVQWGARAGFVPLLAVTVDDEGLRLGLRPVLRWAGGVVEPVLPDAAFPGTAVVAADALDARPDPAEVARLARAVADLDGVAAPVESQLWPKAAGRGRSAYVLVAGTVPAARLRGALQRLAAAGVTDFRFAIPGLAGAFLPAFAFVFPAADDGSPAATGPRARVVVGPGGCTVFADSRSDVPLPADGWPDGVQVVTRDGAPSHLAIPLTAGGRFGERLAGTLRAMELRAGVERVVDLAPLDGAVPSRVLMDAAFEVAGFASGRFPGLEARFPGTGCPAEGPCVGGVPVLFAGEPGGDEG